ncbi:DapH/DapD/GlmU-related protein [Zobellia nedashkovskayae]
MKEIIRLFKNYYFLDVCRLIRDMVFSKLLFPSAVRLIRQPAYIVGKKHISFGENFRLGPNLRLEVLDESFVRLEIHSKMGTPELIIGNNVSLNFNVHIGVIAKVQLGDNVLIASNVLIIDHNHGNYKGEVQDSPLLAPKDRKCIAEPIFIGDNTWLGENVSILPGTKIGEGCIVGANSVVSGVFEKNQIIAGVLQDL